MAVATTVLAAGLSWGTLSGHGSTVKVSEVGLATAATGGVVWVKIPIGGSTPYYVSVADGGSLDIGMNVLTVRGLGGNGLELADAPALALLDAIFGHTTLGPANWYARLFLLDGSEFPATGNYVTQVTATIFGNNTANFPGASMV